jgi:hypothetical protein
LAGAIAQKSATSAKVLAKTSFLVQAIAGSPCSAGSRCFSSASALTNTEILGCMPQASELHPVSVQAGGS